jgi:leader peptidase (prepilin peptidase)/N-methyltransferase
VVAALVEHQPKRIWMLLLGAAINLAIMGAIYLLSRGGMGDGDVRLSPLLGAFLGFLNPGLAPVGLFYGFLLGAIASVPLLITRKADRRTALPFGPFLALGAYLAIFFGQRYIDLILVR